MRFLIISQQECMRIQFMDNGVKLCVDTELHFPNKQVRARCQICIFIPFKCFKLKCIRHNQGRSSYIIFLEPTSNLRMFCTEGDNVLQKNDCTRYITSTIMQKIAFVLITII